MKNKFKYLIILVITILLMTGCFFPTKYVYFTPSSPQGKTYDNIPCGHVTNEKNAIKIKLNKNSIDINAYKNKNNKLVISISVKDPNRDINFDLKKILIKDTTLSINYLPIKHQLTSRNSIYFKKNSRDRETILVHWITLTYDINFDAISNFSLVFPKGTLLQNNKNIKLLPIKFKKKEVNTAAYFTINC